MFSFLRASSPPRTNNASNNPIIYEGGLSSVKFHAPNSQFIMTHTLPPTTPENGTSIIEPPFHYHIYQSGELSPLKICLILLGSQRIIHSQFGWSLYLKNTILIWTCRILQCSLREWKFLPGYRSQAIHHTFGRSRSSKNRFYPSWTVSSVRERFQDR
jgi:hypothetical protein